MRPLPLEGVRDKGLDRRLGALPHHGEVPALVLEDVRQRHVGVMARIAQHVDPALRDEKRLLPQRREKHMPAGLGPLLEVPHVTNEPRQALPRLTLARYTHGCSEPAARLPSNHWPAPTAACPDGLPAPSGATVARDKQANTIGGGKCLAWRRGIAGEAGVTGVTAGGPGARGASRAPPRQPVLMCV